MAKVETDNKTAILIGLLNTKYKIFTSEQVYSIYLEILQGNNTYPLLQEKTGKTQPQLVELMQPLLKTGAITVKPFTGQRGTPSQFMANKNALEELMFSCLRESGFSEQDIVKIKLKLVKEKYSFASFISIKSNLINAKTFAALADGFFAYARIDTNKDNFSIN